MALFGVLVPPTIYFLDRNDKTGRSAIIAIVASLLAFILYGTGRRLLACLLALPVGAVLLAKPFVRPVTYDGRAMSLDSETHYYFLIPGTLMLVVFGALLLSAFEKRDVVPAFADGIKLRIASAFLFGAGIFLGHVQFGGPTVADVIVQYQPRGTAMRAQWQKFASSLPENQFQPLEGKLTPQPVWIENRRSENNIEIITFSELKNPDESPQYGQLYLSDELLHCVRWTGPKNPLSHSVRGDQAGDFSQRMTRAFNLPWLAAYRPGSAGIEVFVFDMKTGQLAAATTTRASLGDYTQGRKDVLAALAKATGGTFELK